MTPSYADVIYGGSLIPSIHILAQHTSPQRDEDGEERHESPIVGHFELGGDFLLPYIAFLPHARPEILFLHLDSQTSTNVYSMARGAN